MNRAIIILVLIHGLLYTAHSQCLTAFEDTRDGSRDYFYIFDNGQIKQQEYTKIQSFKVGRNLVAYVDNSSNFKIYKDGITHRVQTFPPEKYFTTDFLTVFWNTGNYLYVMDDKRIHELDRTGGRVVFGDSVVAFNDYFGSFKIYYKNKVTTITNRLVQRINAQENIVTFVDQSYEYKIFYHGQVLTLESGSEPESFKIHQNIVAYVDFIGDFKIFYKGNLETIESFAPKNYRVGENMVAFISGEDDDVFKVFYDGRIYVLMDIPPKSFSIKDDILVYTDNNNHFYVFYKGKTQRLSNFKPREYHIDNDILIYLDLDEKVQGFIKGKEEQVSFETVKHYELSNQAVMFYKVTNRAKVYCSGKVYNVY